MIRCPRDDNELTKLTSTPETILHCNDCTGVFVKGLPIHQYKSTGVTQPREEWDSEVVCPEHGEKMDSVTVEGVTIDICEKCGGVWLDGDEIETLLGPAYSEHLSSELSAKTRAEHSQAGITAVGALDSVIPDVSTILSFLRRLSQF